MNAFPTKATLPVGLQAGEKGWNNGWGFPLFRKRNRYRMLARWRRRLCFAGKILKLLVPAGQLFGVPIKISLLWLVCPLGVLLWAGSPDALEWRATHSFNWLFESLAVLLMMMDSLLVHEFAHVLAARAYGAGTRRVIFHPFGVLADLEQPLWGRAEFCVALAGPAFSLALAGLFYLCHQTLGQTICPPLSFLPALLRFGVKFNLIVGCFNLLPCFPMDGGRIFRSLLGGVIGTFSRRDVAWVRETATMISVRFVAWPVALGMMLLTVIRTHIWLHLLLFPLLLFAAEIEYWLIRRNSEFE